MPVVKLINIGKGDRRTLLDAAIVERTGPGIPIVALCASAVRTVGAINPILPAPL